MRWTSVSESEEERKIDPEKTVRALVVAGGVAFVLNRVLKAEKEHAKCAA